MRPPAGLLGQEHGAEAVTLVRLRPLQLGRSGCLFQRSRNKMSSLSYAADPSTCFLDRLSFLCGVSRLEIDISAHSHWPR